MTSHLPAPDPAQLDVSQRLSALIADEIRAHRRVPFSRFMERCLYAPGLGYYSAGSPKFGKAGDFVTAPELGNLFAQCMIRSWLPVLRTLDAACVLELGGGSGAFARAALEGLAAAAALPRHYWILEPSADLRQRQRDYLRGALPASVFACVEWLDQPPQAAWQGVLFANEVIDALPVTRFCVHQGEVFEEHVELDADGGFQRVDRPADALVAGAVRHLERQRGAAFEDGYRSELLPQLPYWMQAVAGSLEAGIMQFVDYGHPRRELYGPERRGGTLRAFYRHRMHDDPLVLPGLQDLTASVDFTALAEAGHHAGFEIGAWLPQAQFLIASGLQDAFQREHAALDDEAERYALAQQVKQLTLPGEMGEHFKVMLLHRGVDTDVLPEDVVAASRLQRL